MLRKQICQLLNELLTGKKGNELVAKKGRLKTMVDMDITLDGWLAFWLHLDLLMYVMMVMVCIL